MLEAWLALAVAALLALWVLTLVLWRRQTVRFQEELALLRSAKQSQATRHGQVSEQFLPLVASWPWDPKGFRFLGSPVDGVQFTPDGVVFVEIKTGKSQLTTSQRQVRDHVQAGRVAWHEVRLP